MQKSLLKFALALALAAPASPSLAQIGEPLERLITRLAPNQLTETEDGYLSAGGFSFSTEERGDALYSVTGEGTLDAANADFAAQLIGAVTGYGEQIAAPVRDFFANNLGNLAGQGTANFDVQQYKMTIEVNGEAAPYDTTFTLFLPEIAAEAFPETERALGPVDARYVIREFSDFQCPFCARFVNEGLSVIKEDLLARGDVRFEFHHFPLQSIHANALSAAEASECVTAANSPEAFWTYHDALFERQQAWASLGDPTSYYVRLGQDLGLETGGVEACLNERTFADTINEATQVAGGQLGLSGTPTVFVNGYKVGDYTQLESYLQLMRLADAFAQNE